MTQPRTPKIAVFYFLSAFIGTFLVLHTPLLAQEFSLLPVFTYDSGGLLANFVLAADVNGDGKPDILVANRGSGTVSVLIGNGDGTFQAATSYDSGGSFTYSLAVGDVNGDGKLDLLTTNPGNNTVGVLLGHGDGTFASAVTYDSGGGSFPNSVAIADVNADGVPDIVIVYCSNRFAGCGGGQNGTVAILLGNGDGTFRAGEFYDAGSGPIWLAVADLNGDAKPDIVVADCGANIFCPTSAHGALSVLLGNGDGTFQPAVSYSSGGISAMAVAIADVNGDSKPDLLVANSGSGTVGALLGNGDGTFRSALVYGSGGGAYASNQIVVTDLNGDGKQDLLLANYGNTVAVLLGNGDGTFQSALTYISGGWGSTSVAVKDVNGDGRPDVVVANMYSNNIGVLLNNTPFCNTAPKITLSATPISLWPPTGKMLPVTVSGKITETGNACITKTASYAVKDEYAQVQPSGPVNFGANGAYSFTVWLQASRLGTDLDGRHYGFSVSATNNAGKTGSQAGTVIVPHDQGY